jgi:predicted ATPase
VSGLVVLTGAYRAGKTTLLEHLAAHHGYRCFEEAHRRVLRELGARTAGHRPDAPLSQIDESDHLCPMCHPVAFSERVVAAQRSIETRAAEGDLVDRGLLDPLELRSRRTGEPLEKLVDAMKISYRHVILVEVIPALSEPKWGQSADARLADAYRIEGRLERAYLRAGCRVSRLRPGSVGERAAAVLSLLAAP